MTALQALKQAIAAERKTAQREAELAGYSIAQSAGVTLVAYREGVRVDRHETEHTPASKVTLKLLKSFAAQYQVDELFIDGSIDGLYSLRSYEEGIYDSDVAGYQIQLDPQTLEVIA